MGLPRNRGKLLRHRWLTTWHAVQAENKKRCRVRRELDRGSAGSRCGSKRALDFIAVNRDVIDDRRRVRRPVVVKSVVLQLQHVGAVGTGERWNVKLFVYNELCGTVRTYSACGMLSCNNHNSFCR